MVIGIFKLKVFISSTITDMQAERNAVTEVITTLQHNVSRSEFLPSLSLSPEQVCLYEAANSDIFIGIYDKRYGFVPPEDNFRQISVTHMEYEAAKKNNVSCLIFISNAESDREKKLKDFLEIVKNFSKGQFVVNYKNIDDLKYQVLRSLVYHLKIILSENEFKKLQQLLSRMDLDPYTGSLKWEAINYDECESIDCFSGIRIGSRSIFLKSPYVGEVHFYIFDDTKPKTPENRVILSIDEFNKIINSIFTENEIYWIEKNIWRMSS